MNFIKFYLFNLLSSIIVALAIGFVGYVYVNAKVEMATAMVKEASDRALVEFEVAKTKARLEFEKSVNVATINIEQAKTQATEKIRATMDEQMARATDQFKEGAAQAKDKVQNLLEIGRHTFSKPNTEN